MDGWIVGLVAGGAALLLIVVLLGVVVKAATRTAETAKAVLVALEEVKANMAPLAELGARDFDVGGPLPSEREPSRARSTGYGAGG